MKRAYRLKHAGAFSLALERGLLVQPSRSPLWAPPIGSVKDLDPRHGVDLPHGRPPDVRVRGSGIRRVRLVLDVEEQPPRDPDALTEQRLPERPRAPVGPLARLLLPP